MGKVECTVDFKISNLFFAFFTVRVLVLVVDIAIFFVFFSFDLQLYVFCSNSVCIWKIKLESVRGSSCCSRLIWSGTMQKSRTHNHRCTHCAQETLPPIHTQVPRCFVPRWPHMQNIKVKCMRNATTMQLCNLSWILPATRLAGVKKSFSFFPRRNTKEFLKRQKRNTRTTRKNVRTVH